MRARISKGTKIGQLRAAGKARELHLLRVAWREAGCDARKLFLEELLAPAFAAVTSSGDATGA